MRGIMQEKSVSECVCVCPVRYLFSSISQISDRHTKITDWYQEITACSLIVSSPETDGCVLFVSNNAHGWPLPFNCHKQVSGALWEIWINDLAVVLYHKGAVCLPTLWFLMKAMIRWNVFLAGGSCVICYNAFIYLICMYNIGMNKFCGVKSMIACVRMAGVSASYASTVHEVQSNWGALCRSKCEQKAAGWGGGVWNKVLTRGSS